MRSGHRDLRSFLDMLQQRDALLCVADEVDPYLEVGAAIRETSDRAGPALLFENIKGHRLRAVGGVYSSRALAYMTLGCTRETRLARYLDAIDNPLPVVQVRDAPCQEEVLTGAEVDLGSIPIPHYNVLDEGPYLTVGITISRSYESGAPNASIYRLPVRGRNLAGIKFGPHQHAGMNFAEWERRNEDMPVAVAIGVDPLIGYASQARVPYGIDELTVAGGLRGEPVEVVPAKTVDLLVPAHAEIILEGYMLAGVREPEGPFGEYPGYYTDEDRPASPVVKFTALTRRHDAISQAGLTGRPTTENHVLKEIPLEAYLYRELRQVSPNVVDVHYPAAGATAFIAVVAMAPNASGESRAVLEKLLSIRTRGKYNFIVDSDVDIFDQDQVWHAVATRSQPAAASLIVPDLPCVPLDPSARNGRGSAIGIDATRPVGTWFPSPVQTSGWPKLDELIGRDGS